MKYRKLEGVFLPRDGEKDKKWFTMATKGKISWCTRLDTYDLGKHDEYLWREHFEDCHDNLGIPVEFIT